MHAVKLRVLPACSSCTFSAYLLVSSALSLHLILDAVGPKYSHRVTPITFCSATVLHPLCVQPDVQVVAALTDSTDLSQAPSVLPPQDLCLCDSSICTISCSNTPAGTTPTSSTRLSTHCAAFTFLDWLTSLSVCSWAASRRVLRYPLALVKQIGSELSISGLETQ